MTSSRRAAPRSIRDVPRRWTFRAAALSLSLVLAALALACALSGALPVRGQEGSDPVAETPVPAWTASLTVGQSGSDTSTLTVWGYSKFAVGMGGAQREHIQLG